MFKIDLKTPIRIYFIGIGGISMSALAELLHSKGFFVSGSDRAPSDLTRHLETLGIPVAYGQRAGNITKDIDLAVYTAAVHPDNPEYVACTKLDIPLMDRATLLGEISRCYTPSIGVAGTHGKTTTTGMLSLLLLDAGTDPTISIGGILPAIGGNLRIGDSSYFLYEACEYTNSFLQFYPTDAIILNIDRDHLDFFKDLEDIRHSFRRYAERVPKDGALIINGAIPNLSEIVEGLPCTVLTYGILQEGDAASAYDYAAAALTFNEQGCASFHLFEGGEEIGSVSLSVPGRHNVENALAAIAQARRLDLPLSCIVASLKRYTGTNRRFEKKGEIGGVTIIDDYAHHPTEIAATLRAANACPHETLWCVFQPHTYTRTKLLRAELVEALSLADKIVLADIYAAREQNPGDISSLDLCADLKALGKDCFYFPCFDDIETFLLKNCVNGDLLITMGAGDIVKVGESLLGK